MTDNGKSKNRRERRAARKEGNLQDPAAFLKAADQFIEVANRQNRTVLATDLASAFLFAAARYNAHVAKNVLEVERHEHFVEEKLKVFAEMLRQNLADPDL
jgi:hypothetical protein